MALASFFPVQDLVNTIVTSMARFAPPEVLAIVRDQLVEIANGDQAGLLTFGMLATLWSTSAAMVSIIGTLNEAYDLTESRAWWKVRLTAIGLTLAVALFILVSFGLVLAGPALAERIADQVNLGAAFVSAWTILQWPVIFVLVATAIGLIYHFAPDAEQEWVWITPGAVVATTLWLLVSLGFKYYVATWGSYAETYGAIAGVIILLLWFYVTALAVLIGAELNAEIEHSSPYGKEPGEWIPGERKKIGVLAARLYRERTRGRSPAPLEPLPAGVNCMIDRPLPAARPRAAYAPAKALTFNV